MIFAPMTHVYAVMGIAGLTVVGIFVGGLLWIGLALWGAISHRLRPLDYAGLGLVGVLLLGCSVVLVYVFFVQELYGLLG